MHFSEFMFVLIRYSLLYLSADVVTGEASSLTEIENLGVPAPTEHAPTAQASLQPEGKLFCLNCIYVYLLRCMFVLTGNA